MSGYVSSWKYDLTYGKDYTTGPIGTSNKKFKYAIPYEYKSGNAYASYFNQIFCDNPIIADQLIENYNGTIMPGRYQLVDLKVVAEKNKEEFKKLWTDSYSSGEDTTKEYPELGYGCA